MTITHGREYPEHSELEEKLLINQPMAMKAKSDKSYYDACVGMWYTVWWDSEQNNPALFKSHWMGETRIYPIKDGYYAADDVQKLRNDFTYFNTIGIDFLLLDDTNDHRADSGNIAEHIDACFHTARELGSTAAPKLCFCGGSPLLNNNEQRMVEEMDIFYDYAQQYAEHTFYLDSKPLFVNFNIPTHYEWQDPKGRFTMRPAAGHTSEGSGYINKSYLEKVGMFGWVFDRQYPNSGVYGINPGWSRCHNGQTFNAPPLSREHGDYYRKQWLNAIKSKPNVIIVASWNDHSEETGIEAVKLLEPIPGRGEEDPFFYQRITEGYLALKQGFLDGFVYCQESRPDRMYLYQNKRLQEIPSESLQQRHPYIIVPDDYFAWAGMSMD